MYTNITSLDIQKSITLTTTNNGTLNMSEFFSLKFSQFYMSGDIPGSCKLYMLQFTDSGMNMLTALEDFF